MNSRRIEHILGLDPRCRDVFHGFGNPDFPLPLIKKYPAVFVLNTAPFFSSGEHWCVICIESKGSCYFFDSYGYHPKYYGFEKVLLNHCHTVSHNQRKVQGDLSKTCGHHCIYFI